MGLAKVTGFITGKGAKKVAAAEEIIANAEQVNKALCDKGNQRIAAAQRREGAAARIEKAANNIMAQADKVKNALEHNAKLLNARIAKQEIIIEKEVERRLSPHNFAERHQQENERYLQKQRSIFAADLEQQQQKGREEQQRKQQLFERAKHKTTKGLYER